MLAESLSELHNSASGQDVYVVGTGPTARLFPARFFDGRKVIGLNAAYRFCQPDISVTIHPDEALMPAIREKRNAGRMWLTKPKGATTLEVLKNLPVACHVISTTESLQSIGVVDAPFFVGRGIHQTGIDLAIRMGARAIFLAGIDMGSLGGDHHGCHHHVRFHGLPAEDAYKEYREWMAAVRAHVRRKYGIPIMSVSPLLGVCLEEDYARLTAELKLAKLPKPKDTSGYRRASTDPPPKS
jgi:hypothetical protein